jgi:hypothetical protein
MERNIVLGPDDDLADLSNVQEALTLDGGGGNDTVVGPDALTTFMLTGLNSGTIVADTFGTSVIFSNVENVTGGDVANTLVFGNGNGITGRVVGGNGTNTLDYHSYTTSVEVVLPLGYATGVGGGVSGITMVIGGNDGGTGTYNLLVGEDGSTLQGGTGRRNVLIAGNQPARLTGGDSGDILIGGYTEYDMDLVSLRTLAQEWAGSGDAATRMGLISTPTSSGPYLNSSDVTSNIDPMNPSQINTLTGSGQDWFFATTQETPASYLFWTVLPVPGP